MLVSLKWLRELVEIDATVPELVERLDMTGTAVESVRTVGEAFAQVVVGQVLKCEAHPDAEKLTYCEVGVGENEPARIVCGATNFKVGDKVPVALPGAELAGGLTIKKAKLRGLVSEGMMCSPSELGLGTESSGLLILPSDAPVGTPFSEYAGITDTVLDLEITPNRPDCMSVAGVAREVGAILGVDASMPSSTPEEGGAPVEAVAEVRIDAPELCARYAARLIRGVRIGPSPEWLAQRVTAAGARPINNVVDVTNLVMFELGQPLHAFDAATIAAENGRITVIVRRAQAGESLRTLDGQDRRLDADTLVIADPNGAIALAGVMGGEATEVSESTVDVLLESACFSPTSIGRTSRSLGLTSEASIRFERGVDRAGCVAAADRAATLIAEVSGGVVAPGVLDEYPVPPEPTRIRLRMDRLNSFLGTRMETDGVRSLLGRLGIETTVSGDAGQSVALDVTVPTFRPDLEREVDVIEEVVRLWGMDRVEGTLPGGRGRAGGLTADQKWRRTMHTAMRAAGLNETMTYSFGDPTDVERFGLALGEGEMLVELLNPMSEEQAVMRWTLAPGLLRSVAYNQSRGTENVHLYEMGMTFRTSAGRKLPKERMMIAGALAGRWNDTGWADPRPARTSGSDASDATLRFFDGKGVIDTLLESIGVGRWKARDADHGFLQPGRAADVIVGGDVVGWIGEVHPAVLDTFEATGPVVMFELSVEMLTRAAVGVRKAQEVPRHPAVMLDVALVVQRSVTAERVGQAIVGAGGKLLESARLFDVYEGDGVPEGMKSLAFSLTYRAPDRTLTDDEIRPLHERLVRKVCTAVEGTLRA